MLISHKGFGEEGALREAVLPQHHPGLQIFQFSPAHTSHFLLPVMQPTQHSPNSTSLFHCASLSSAGTAQALMQPNGAGGQCSAVGTPPQPRGCLQHQHSCRSKPSALFPVLPQLLNLHVCKLRLQVLTLRSTET